MAYENLLFEVGEGIATVTINRPKKLNALNRATLVELDEVFGLVRARADLRAAILTGSGDRAFVAGADIDEMSRLGAAEAHAFSLYGQGVLDRIEQLGKPVIAAVNGFALGGGCELAMAATIRLASENAQFGQPEVKLGLIPGFAGTQRLARLVGRSRALELILTGESISAAEAMSIGLVSRVVARDVLGPETRQLAAKILERAPRAVSYALEAVQRGSEAGFQAGSRLEAGLFAILFATEDMKEGTRAFLDKRAPSWKDC